MIQRLCYTAIVSDKPSVEVIEPKEELYSFDYLWLFLVPNNFDFSFVYLDTVCRYYKA